MPRYSIFSSSFCVVLVVLDVVVVVVVVDVVAAVIYSHIHSYSILNYVYHIVMMINIYFLKYLLFYFIIHVSCRIIQEYANNNTIALTTPRGFRSAMNIHENHA